MTTQSTATTPIFDLAEVRAQVQQIEALVAQRDYEAAHGLERQLWDSVLEAIACGTAQAGYLASAALVTKEIDFPRWMA